MSSPGLPRVFSDVPTFVQYANSILQRRKARAGRSLELHVRRVLVEEGLEEGRDFDYNVESEPGRRPDFLFPSQAAYRDPAFPERNLRMLAAKTTSKDRWRQIISEAPRIRKKHLLTLQADISAEQIQEMTASFVTLVIPRKYRDVYPEELRARIRTLAEFISETKSCSYPG